MSVALFLPTHIICFAELTMWDVVGGRGNLEQTINYNVNLKTAHFSAFKATLILVQKD